MTIFFFLLLIVLIWIKIRDWALSSLLVTIFSFQFYLPNKYYPIEVFRPYELQPGFGPYFLSYGINLENIFLLITLILIIRNLILKKSVFPKKSITYILPAIFSAILFFLISLYSSLRFSPYSSLSVTWLLQDIQLFLVGFSVFYVFFKKRSDLKLISPVILSSIVLQSAVSIIQFVKQSWAGLPIESFIVETIYYGSPDAVHSYFRVAGTFGHPNQLALILCAMLVLILPQVIGERKPVYILGSFITVLVILLTQSRSGWLALFVVILLTTIIYRNELLKPVSKLAIRRIAVSITLVIAVTLAVAVPRIVASFNAFYQNAGFPLRIEMAKEAILAIAQNPWLGYGMGTNEPVLFRLFPMGYIYSFPAPIHMAYLQMILESGILGFLFFMFPFVYIIRCIINRFLLYGAKKIARAKNYIFITLAGISAFGSFYLFLPYEGFREFAYLGIIFGYGMICLQPFKAFPK